VGEGEVRGFVREAASDDGREQRWMRSGSRPPSPDDLAALVGRAGPGWEERFGAARIGLGSCGERIPGSPGALCIRLRLWLCSVSVEEAIATVAGELDGTPFAGRTVGLHIDLVGATRPRCAAGDAACGPLPYEGSLAESGYDCHDERVLAVAEWPELADRMRGYTGGACRHDGECLVAGCGNHCVSWEARVAEGTCEGYSVLEDAPALCGCVEGRCAWFVD
jgi:hypothetical protein